MNKIFISIASYRDSELIPTVKSLIENAAEKDLLRIVVFEQNDYSDPSLKGIFPEWQVQIINTHYLNARGPTWARYIIQREYLDEEYYMQIDSHMRVVKYWDIRLKQMLSLLPEPSVLTQYPVEYKIGTENLDTSIVRSGLYIQGFGIEDGFTRLQSSFAKFKSYYPYTSKGWSACFSFSKGSIVKDAPYGSETPHLFFGEELDITLRLYTRGYYFFSPHETVIFTLFKRNHRRTYWQDIPSSLRTLDELKSRERIWNKIINCVDMGTIRTINDYIKFADIESIVENRLLPTAKSFRKPCTKILYR